MWNSDCKPLPVIPANQHHLGKRQILPNEFRITSGQGPRQVERSKMQ